jgi:hypothetical protein
MYSEQLAVLLFIAATQMANQGVSPQPTAQLPRHGNEQIGLNMKLVQGTTSEERQRARAIKRQRAALMLAEVR